MWRNDLTTSAIRRLSRAAGLDAQWPRQLPLPQALRAFCRDRRGAVAIIVAFALIPVAAMMGLALDYSRASLAKAELQAAVDSAGLAAAQMPRDTSLEAIKAKAQEWVEASLSGKGMGAVTVDAKKVDSNLTFEVSTTVPMTLFSLVRRAPLPLVASNQVTWDIGKVEIALVLDNTGSMSTNNKIDNLKTAATKLVDVLQKAVTKPDQVKIGIVPFSMTVKIGSSYKDQTWISQHALSPINQQIFWDKVTDKPTSPNRFDLFSKLSLSWGGCVESRPAPYDIQDTAPSTTTPATLFVPFFAPDEPNRDKNDNTGSYPNSYLNDGGSWTEFKKRQGNVAKYLSPSWTGGGTGPNLGCDMTSILRLSTDLAAGGAVRNKITAMKATGETNIPMGLIWGWHLLAPHAPFSDGVPYDTENVTKYVILMTDGENTYGDADKSANENNSDYTGLGYIWQRRLGNTTDNPGTSTRTGLMNDRLQALCTNMKKKPASGQPKSSAAPDIQVYTIGVGVNDTTRGYLQKCASLESMYHDVTATADMTPVFTRIADEISQLRLSK
jgi:Flp pilus assembly protein TadG